MPLPGFKLWNATRCCFSLMSTDSSPEALVVPRLGRMPCTPHDRRTTREHDVGHRRVLPSPARHRPGHQHGQHPRQRWQRRPSERACSFQAWRPPNPRRLPMKLLLSRPMFAGLSSPTRLRVLACIDRRLTIKALASLFLLHSTMAPPGSTPCDSSIVWGCRLGFFTNAVFTRVSGERC